MSIVPISLERGGCPKMYIVLQYYLLFYYLAMLVHFLYKITNNKNIFLKKFSGRQVQLYIHLKMSGINHSYNI